MKKLLLALIACCILVTPVLAADDELTNLSDQQLLAVYDAVLAEVQRRSLNTSAQTQRDPSIVFGQNIHVQQGELTVCQPTPIPDYTSAQPVQLPIVPTATPIPAGGDKAAYDSQNPEDYTHIAAGSLFDITWYLLNTGTTTWTDDYCLRVWNPSTDYTKVGKSRFYILAPAAPNTIGTFVVDAVAPTKPGTYTMPMVLSNGNDENFFMVDITFVVD